MSDSEKIGVRQPLICSGKLQKKNQQSVATLTQLHDSFLVINIRNHPVVKIQNIYYIIDLNIKFLLLQVLCLSKLHFT